MFIARREDGSRSHLIGEPPKLRKSLPCVAIANSITNVPLLVATLVPWLPDQGRIAAKPLLASGS
jgi:hypothetical protein